MKVGWLVDSVAYKGGAEYTMAEFAAAAPDGVEIVECPPGEVEGGLDRYVVGNCITYKPRDIDAMGDVPRTRYVHDVWPHGDGVVRQRLLKGARLIFCSPLHRDRFPWPHAGGLTIPPALDLTAPEPAERSGTVWVGRMYAGKGVAEVCEWADENVDFYGFGPIAPSGDNFTYKGELDQADVVPTLAKYERFVFLPTVLEPFARTVAEAWIAGCKITTNHLVGALHWITDDPDALETAADDFWAEVLR